MGDKKYYVVGKPEIKFYNATTGEEIIDIRDQKPIERKFDPDIPILDLVKSTSPSYSLCTHPLMKKYGYDTFGSICEAWYWDDNLSDATQEELWKMYALIQSDWAMRYRYMYDMEVYEFRKYKKENTTK